MSQIAPITVNVDELIAVNKYEVDEESAHIELVEDPDIEEFKKLVRVCPAALYKIDEDGATSFDYAGLRSPLAADCPWAPLPYARNAFA